MNRIQFFNDNTQFSMMYFVVISLMHIKVMIHVFIPSGAAYAKAENSVKRFIESTRFPFLPTPMGKGVLPDDHNLCVSPARSK